jgi:hypothetical protein
MLFIIVMDVLGYLLSKAEEDGLLQELSSRHRYNRISLYADDVAIFLHPSSSDIAATLEILGLFGAASGLHKNNQKSSVFPIQCSEEDVAVAHEWLHCEFASFPCRRYLGLPLSLRKITKEQAQPIVDKIVDQLLGWKAELMTRAGRRVQVQHVLTGALVYLAMAIDVPQSALKVIDKIRRGFL